MFIIFNLFKTSTLLIVLSAFYLRFMVENMPIYGMIFEIFKA